MDLGNPIRSVIPSAQGDVLAVLARTDQPLTGRRVAALTNRRVSQKGTNLALRALLEAGLVIVEDHPPAKLYSLNRRHLAANPIEELASLRDRLIEAMRAQLASWLIPAWGVWLFGSAARGDGDETSDIDVLVVRPDEVDDADPRWLNQVERFVAAVTAWAGNSCEVVEYALSEFDALLSRDDRLACDIRSDGINLTSQRLPRRSPAGRQTR
jgi:hypothetical protein